jgi:hypothetical protein
MLICASVGAMAFGILAAYAILRAGFALMRPKPWPSAVKSRPSRGGFPDNSSQHIFLFWSRHT